MRGEWEGVGVDIMIPFSGGWLLLLLLLPMVLPIMLPMLVLLEQEDWLIASVSDWYCGA